MLIIHFLFFLEKTVILPNKHMWSNSINVADKQWLKWMLHDLGTVFLYQIFFAPDIVYLLTMSLWSNETFSQSSKLQIWTRIQIWGETIMPQCLFLIFFQMSFKIKACKRFYLLSTLHFYFKNNNFVNYLSQSKL